MYAFGIAVLLGLGVMCVARCLDPLLRLLGAPASQVLHPLAELALGIGLAWAVNFDLWALWHIPMPADWVAITLTGVALGGIARSCSPSSRPCSRARPSSCTTRPRLFERPKLKRVA